MPTSCDITLDHPERVYYAGQVLRGIVNLTLSKEHTVRGVFVRIFGKAEASWREYCNRNHNINQRDRNGHGHYVTYSDKEYYMNRKIYFVGGESADEFQLQPGTHNYTFEYVLPGGLPTSFSHKKGSITYGVTVGMDIPFWFDKKFIKHFTVIKAINLNTDPVYRYPASDKDNLVLYALGCCCCWPSDPLEVEAKTPVRGYTPGQTINVRINVNNETKEPIDKFEVAFIKRVTLRGTAYNHGTKYKKYKYVIAGRETSGCSPGEKASINVNFQLPSIPPTDSTSSRVVHISYYIRNSEPVIINQPTAPPIPIEESGTNALPIPMQPLPMSESILPNTIHFDPNNDLPTYEEAMSVEGPNTNEYTPKYPMFKRQTSYLQAN